MEFGKERAMAKKDYLFKSTTILSKEEMKTDEDQTVLIGETASVPEPYGDQLRDMGLCDKIEKGVKKDKKAAPDDAKISAAQADVTAAEELLAKASDDEKSAAQAALDAAKAALAELSA
jgi:multidrug efflux pump subunit AcrA (membrane-fusion protein)